MSRGALLVAGVVVALLALPVAFAARQLATAEARLDSALAARARVSRDVARVEALRGREERIADRKRPTDDVSVPLEAVLREVGITDRQRKGVTPGGDTALPTERDGPSYRRQDVHVTLQGLSVRDLGALLETWRRHQELWTPTRIDLKHSRGGDRYDVTLILSAVYIWTGSS